MIRRYFTKYIINQHKEVIINSICFSISTYRKTKGEVFSENAAEVIGIIYELNDFNIGKLSESLEVCSNSQKKSFVVLYWIWRATIL